MMRSLRKARNAAGRARGFGDCLRCGDSWSWKKDHITEFGNAEDDWAYEGMFPLCEECWQGLKTPENRLPYYQQLLEMWREEHQPERLDLYHDALGKARYYESKWERIKKAVIAGG